MTPMRAAPVRTKEDVLEAYEHELHSADLFWWRDPAKRFRHMERARLSLSGYEPDENPERYPRSLNGYLQYRDEYFLKALKKLGLSNRITLAALRALPLRSQD